MATFTFTLTVTSPDATLATFMPAGGPFIAPVTPGTVIGAVSVEPPDWNGLIVVDAPFAMAGHNVVVGAAALTVGSYLIDGTVTP